VLNSYFVGEDGVFKYYEVILIDPNHNAIRHDPKLQWTTKNANKHREIHGLTSAGRKHRGLRSKGHGVKKLRPSRKGSWKRRNKVSLRRYR
jgi:large subunit ribosomal protein L15e